MNELEKNVNDENQTNAREHLVSMVWIANQQYFRVYEAMRLSKSKIDNTSTDYKPNKIRDAFESRYVEFKSDKDKKSLMKEYLKILG